MWFYVVFGATAEERLKHLSKLITSQILLNILTFKKSIPSLLASLSLCLQCTCSWVWWWCTSCYAPSTRCLICMAWLPFYSCHAVKILTRMRTESPSWITARVPRGRQKRVPAITLSRDHRCPTTPSTGAELWGRREKGKKLHLSQIPTSWTTDGTWGLGGLILNSCLSFLFFFSFFLFIFFLFNSFKKSIGGNIKEDWDEFQDWVFEK